MSISRILTKTPIQNERSNIYETDINDELIQTILQSRFIGEGVFCLEQYSMADYCEYFVVSPSFDKYSYTYSDKEWNFDGENDAVAYELILDKPYFLPLDDKPFLNLFKFISTIDSPIFTQVLLTKRLDNWRSLAIEKYLSFLKGNENPLDNNLLRKFQSKVINVLNKVGSYQVEREDIPEIEDKITGQHIYRFECRIVLFNSNYQRKFEEKIGKDLKKLNLFNDLVLKMVKNKKALLKNIQDRSFQLDLTNNMLSEKEIISLLAEKEMRVSTSYTPVATPIKKGVSQRLEESQLLQMAIKLLPFKEKKNLTVDKKIATQIQQAFARVKISKESLKVTNIERGSRIQKIEIKIPSDINYSHIKKNVDNIKAVLGKDSLSIEISDKPEIINLYVPCDDTELIYLVNILENQEFQEFAKDKALPFIIGEDVVGKPLFACLNELRHLLIAGESGSGKSVFLNCLLICLILYVNPNELVLYLVDPKKVELKPYDGFPQVREVITDMNKASTLLDKLTIEMDKRFEILSREGYRDVMGYNKSRKNKIPYIVFVVDEYADLVSTNPEVEEYIQRLGGKARACGIHLIIATQRPSANILDGAIKTNLPARLSFKLETTSDYMTVFGNGIPFEPLGRGDGCARIETLPKHYQRFQSPIITLDDEVWIDVISNLKNLFKGVSNTDIELSEIVKVEPIDELKKIIVNTGELKFSKLREMMGKGSNYVKSLIDQLIEEEFLKKEANGSYSLNINQEELDKWKE
jgi:DNA segregation ATPase FtsK/SpoIIIE, S-DNA-T family